jgi:nicotinate-nucleotide adenylyltransferase
VRQTDVDCGTFMRQLPLSRFGRMAAMPPPAGAGQRIGLLGGSFNPPHAAHLLISEIALKRLQLDRLWWVITPGNPLKSRHILRPLADRVAACQALIQDPRIVTTTFEKDLPTAFTAATLDFLRVRYPRAQFVWIMGADCLAQFHRWQQWRHIFETMPIAVIDRPAWRLKAHASPAAKTFARQRLAETKAKTLAGLKAPAWTLISGPLSPLSSTKLRADAQVASHAPFSGVSADAGPAVGALGAKASAKT